jgi:hypothetical protein
MFPQLLQPAHVAARSFQGQSATSRTMRPSTTPPQLTVSSLKIIQSQISTIDSGIRRISPPGNVRLPRAVTFGASGRSLRLIKRTCLRRHYSAPAKRIRTAPGRRARFLGIDFFLLKEYHVRRIASVHQLHANVVAYSWHLGGWGAQAGAGKWRCVCSDDSEGCILSTAQREGGVNGCITRLCGGETCRLGSWNVTRLAESFTQLQDLAKVRTCVAAGEGPEWYTSSEHPFCDTLVARLRGETRCRCMVIAKH